MFFIYGIFRSADHTNPILLIIDTVHSYTGSTESIATTSPVPNLEHLTVAVGVAHVIRCWTQTPDGMSRKLRLYYYS